MFFLSYGKENSANLDEYQKLSFESAYLSMTKDYIAEFESSHAGELLKYGFIEAYNLNIKTVARMLNISPSYLSKIVNGHNSISTKLALRLEALTGMPAHKWISIQERYDSLQMNQNEDYLHYKNIAMHWRESVMGELKDNPICFEKVAEQAEKTFLKNI